jgi:hypothetical protein
VRGDLQITHGQTTVSNVVVARRYEVGVVEPTDQVSINVLLGEWVQGAKIALVLNRLTQKGRVVTRLRGFEPPTSGSGDHFERKS